MIELVVFKEYQRTMNGDAGLKQSNGHLGMSDEQQLVKLLCNKYQKQLYWCAHTSAFDTSKQLPLPSSIKKSSGREANGSQIHAVAEHSD